MSGIPVDMPSYQLDDRYLAGSGRVLMNGTQALVRILLDQARRDTASGWRTAGFVSGYRGSPLGGVDLELWREASRIAAAGIEFLPAVNEDLAATAVLGSQQVESQPKRQVDGVFGLWYGKGPGLDRAGDALRHGNAYGCSPHGGVLVVAGDDHGCVSSSMPHQSDVAFMTWFMPTLNPATVAEYLEYGEYGYALSRFSGMWVGFKAISETVESSVSFELKPDRIFSAPAFDMPADGLHYRWPDLPGPQIEQRLVHKKQAVLAFAEANPIDHAIYRLDNAVFGIVTTGKAHLDTMEALRLLGVDKRLCARLGIDIYKVGMVWPLARADALRFVRGKREVLVIEEKRGIIESQFKEYFYDWPGDKPDLMVGKRDEHGKPLVPWTGELSPRLLVPVIAARLERLFPGSGFSEKAAQIVGQSIDVVDVAGATRTPYFCSGCPHNTSTKVPQGSQALAGIGCHFMASWMNRDTTSLIQMGGEGVNWVASSKFTDGSHVFQNLGEGTWYHSGSMAIRQAVAANTNITYKILFNDAVAMTGGQPVDGPVSVHAIAHSVRAEGVQEIVIVSDNPDRLCAADFPAGVAIHARSELDAVQRRLRQVPGVSVLIYQQPCATELRRKRKRGQAPAPDKVVVINELVCEGCGDCSVESNCLSVEPVPTRYGTRRRINQSACNKDYSCLNGFCPSFVTVTGKLKKPQINADALQLPALPEPVLPSCGQSFDLLITGVGGTGVVTVAAVLSMAAHLEGRGVSVLDFTGFAQKFGPVLSFVRIAENPAVLNQARIDDHSADALIGCDVVVSASARASRCYRHGMLSVMNSASMPTGDIVQQPDASLRVDERLQSIASATGVDSVPAIDANRVSTHYFGDAVYANVIMLGFAWQNALVPVGREALYRALALNAVAVENNQLAFELGRTLAVHDDWQPAIKTIIEPLDELVKHRVEFLTQYQNARYAKRYQAVISRFRDEVQDEELIESAARSLFKLMAYKDEYEVARLHSSTEFSRSLRRQFEAGFTLNYHLAPAFLSFAKDSRGRPEKKAYGHWAGRLFKLLAACRVLRGTPLDVFGMSSERRSERALIRWYIALIEQCGREYATFPNPQWQQILQAPMRIRGYGPVKAAAVERIGAEVEQALAAISEKVVT